MSQENKRVLIKPDQTQIVITGSSVSNIVNVGSGQQVYKGTVAQTAQFRTLVAGADVGIATSGDTIIISAGVTGTTTYTPLATFQAYTGTTAPATFLGINALDGYWNSGQTVSYINSQGFITSLSGYWNSGQTVSYINNQNYLTGVTWGDVTGKPTLFSGNYGDLTNKPDLSVYLTGVTWNDITNKPELWTSGQTVSYINSQGFITSLSGYWTSAQTVTYIDNQNYLTGVTWTDVTGKPTLFSGSYDDLTDKPTIPTLTSDLTNDSGFITGVTWSDVSDKPDVVLQETFTGYTATTAPATYAPLDSNIVSLSAGATLDATYKGKIVECNGTFTVTFPDSMDNGMKVDIINIGTGTITLAASTTLQSKDSNVTLPNQYGGASVYHRGSNTWLAVGDLE